MDNKETAKLLTDIAQLISSMEKDLTALWTAVSEVSTAHTVKHAALLISYIQLLEKMPKGVIEEMAQLKIAEPGTGCACPIKNESLDSLLKKIVLGDSTIDGGHTEQ